MGFCYGRGCCFAGAYYVDWVIACCVLYGIKSEVPGIEIAEIEARFVEQIMRAQGGWTV